MLKNVYVRGVGGQIWAKFCLRSFWTTPKVELHNIKRDFFNRASLLPGTQCHKSVSKAMHDYLNKPGAHLMGNYPGAVNTISTTTKARVAAAAFFNAKPEEVGQSCGSIDCLQTCSTDQHYRL